MSAVLSARPGHLARAWLDAVENRVALAVAVAILLLLLAVTEVVRSVVLFIDSSRQVAHTHQVLEQIEEVFASLSDAVSGVRAYVITGDDTYISQRDSALSELETAMLNLRELTAEHPEQHRRLATLETHIAERRETLNETQLARQSGGFESARTVIASGQPRSEMDRIRLILNEMEAAERVLLEEREGTDASRTRRLFLTGALLIAFVIATITAGLLRLRRELAQRLQLAREIDEGRRFLESVVEHIPSMVFVKDAERLAYVRFNRAGEQLLGLDRTMLLGKTDMDFLPEKLAAKFQAVDRSVLSAGGVLDIPEETIKTRLNGVRTVHTRKIVIPGPDGNPAYLLGISDDVTDRLAAMRRIEELNRNLERQAAELEGANKELEGFSYSVSHDLRSPLRAIDSFAQMLEEDYGGRLDGEAVRYISVIRSGSQKMSRLIDDLLAYAKLGRHALSVAPVDMTLLASQAMQDALAAHDGPVPRITIHELPMAQVDRVVFRQVWENLIGNAIKYSAKSNDPCIVVTGDVSGSYCNYHVQDNGAGFDMRYYDKLFGVFQRLHSEREFTGTGVGLAIVQRVVTRHGGRVWAESEPGSGATFHFSLPAGGRS